MAETKSAERKQAKAKRRRDKEVRPQEIVAAAFEEFSEKGFADTRLEDVAARAGVSPESIYKGFGTKAALAKETFDVTIAGDDEHVHVLGRGLGRQGRDDVVGLDLSSSAIERARRAAATDRHRARPVATAAPAPVPGR